MYIDTSRITRGGKTYYAASAAPVLSRQWQGPPPHTCQCEPLFRGRDRSDPACPTTQGGAGAPGDHPGRNHVAARAVFGCGGRSNTFARRLGIAQALGTTREGKLALWQVIARVIDQGSRLSAVRLAMSHAACDVLGLGTFDEDALYENLDWLAGAHARIEDRLFAQRQKTQPASLFLYDVTSSYLEGTQNALAAFGYNRDGKKGKPQIVIGLLCDEDGQPVSIEVFPGHTQDPRTVASQIEKLKDRFGVTAITFVGDRGMIKGQQIEDLAQHGFHYITAITKPQIEKLLRTGTLQMDLFDQELAEVLTDEGIRYVLRRNPMRAQEMRDTRHAKLATLQAQVAKQNQYLTDHPRANAQGALQSLWLGPKSCASLTGSN